MKAIISLVYVSKSKVSFSSDDLTELSNQASKANKLYNITGFLFYFNDHFLQYLEGPEKELKTLMADLERDVRHDVLITVFNPTKSIRRFPDWAMQYISEEIRMEHVVLSYLIAIHDLEDSNHTARVEKVWNMMEKIFEQVRHLSIA